ncbi:hypothetical protein AOCH_004596 [Aspergillus ochraceoroseus]|uniref:DUF7924 domain-containing protein n=1 Tax=Aspergillus ochraceoroseus TaxID=138278 RepID=A0A0F8UJ18_9EURO|nr:hypothetical protein AOCH_004596 [Aspergillus ochraceoroseus]
MKRTADRTFSAHEFEKQAKLAPDPTPYARFPLKEEYLAQLNMAAGLNTASPHSISSLSRSRSSSLQKLSESIYRTRTLFRAGIYIDVNAPEEVRDAKDLLNDLEETLDIISDPGATPLNLRFPFFLVEAKSGATGGNLYQAQNRAAVAGASAIEILKALYKACEGPLPNTATPSVTSTTCQLLTFSATTEGPACELWAHFWNEVDGSYCMTNIDMWRTTCKTRALDLVSKISSILNWGSSTFHATIVEKLIFFSPKDSPSAL